MDHAQKLILSNQVEIMWALIYQLKKANPDLVGRGGELDRMVLDMTHAAKVTSRFIEGD